MAADPILSMTFEKLSQCSKVWPDIFVRSKNASPFISYEWFTAFCSTILKSDIDVIVCRDKDEPIGIIPAIINDDMLTFIADERITDLVDIIALPGQEHHVIERLALLIDDNDLMLDLCPVENDGLLCRMLPTLIPDIKTVQADLCPVIALAGSWEEYLNDLPSKARHELRRKMRKASGIRIQKNDKIQLNTILKLIAASSPSKERFLEDDICAFFCQLGGYFSIKKWLRLHLAYAGPTPIAALFAFQMKDRIYLYNSGFDPDFCQLSPGIITIGQDIKSGIEEGFKYYDFLRGAEAYKFGFGARTRYTMKLKR